MITCKKDRFDFAIKCITNQLNPEKMGANPEEAYEKIADVYIESLMILQSTLQEDLKYIFNNDPLQMLEERVKELRNVFKSQ